MVSNINLHNLLPVNNKGNIPSTGPVKAPNIPLTASLSFPQTQATGANIHFKTTKAPISDALVQEVNTILEAEGNQIEAEINALEKHGPQKDVIDATLEVGGWGAFAASTSNKSVLTGVAFLQKLFPAHLIHEISSAEKLTEVGKYAELAGAFLGALDSGFQGVALICKYNILRESKELLHQVKKHAGLKSLQPSQMTAEQKKIDKQIREWEVQIELEERALVKESVSFELENTAAILELANVPLTHLPQEMILKPLGLASAAPLEVVTTAIPLVSSGLGVIASGLKLHQTSKAADMLNRWTQSYKKWQKDVQAEQKNSLTSLLTKRKNIQEEKIKKLIPQFENVKEKVQEATKPPFIRAVHKLLEDTLTDPHLNRKDIEEQFKKLQFFDPTLKTSSPELYTALENFKNAATQTQANLAKQKLIIELNKWISNPSIVDKHFDKWFAVQPKKELLATYVDHQETLEITTKNALKQMVGQKHTLESRLHQFKLIQSKIKFNVAAISLAVSIALAIIGLVTTPFGGAGFILLGLSVGSIAISLGLFGAGYMYYRSYKPHTSKTLTWPLQIKMAWTKLRTSLQTYSHQAKEKKLFAVAHILEERISKILHAKHPSKKTVEKDEIKYRAALAKYQKAKNEFDESQAKVDHWTERLTRYQTKLTKEGWKDFAQYASLQIAPDKPSNKLEEFDTLEAFKEAFQASDFSLLNEETKTLLELQLGVNVEDLQAQMKQDETMKNKLQKFFTLEDSGLVNFIRTQQARMKKGLLQPQI